MLNEAKRVKKPAQMDNCGKTRSVKTSVAPGVRARDAPHRRWKSKQRTYVEETWPGML